VKRPVRGPLLTSERKSQLAVEYAYRIRSESPETWVFWVHASNEARFEQSFRDIADQLKIARRQHPNANVFKLVENWLRDERKGKWICILDDMDDDKLLCSLPAAGKGASTKEPPNASAKPLSDYIPQNRNRSVIITSRSKEVALKMVKPKDLIEVNPMARSEALELLQKTLDQPKESQASQHLGEELEFMPLAISQAAGYIRNRATRYSVSQYSQPSNAIGTRLRLRPRYPIVLHTRKQCRWGSGNSRQGRY